MTEKNVEEGTFTGLAAVYGREFDTFSGPLVIEPGAFSKSLREDSDRHVVLWQHNEDAPIGRPIDVRETLEGIHIQGRISQTTLGKDVLTLMRDGVIREMSIGLDRIEETKDKSGLTRLKRGKIWEFSLVTWGAAPGARVLEVHKAPREPVAEPEYPLELQQAIGRAAELELKYGALPRQLAVADIVKICPESAELLNDCGVRSIDLDAFLSAVASLVRGKTVEV